jgi:hypothetical protein
MATGKGPFAPQNIEQGISNDEEIDMTFCNMPTYLQIG